MRRKHQTRTIFGISAALLTVGFAAWAQNLNMTGQLTASGPGVHSFMGKVGIGTTAPAYSLQVNGAISLAGSLLNGTPRFITYDDGTNTSYTTYNTDAVTRYKSTAPFYWLSVPAGATRLTDPGTIAMSIAGTNVGIGTTSPVTKLDVGSSSGDTIRSYGGFVGNAAANIGGTGAAAFFPNGAWLNGSAQWIYGTVYTNGNLYDNAARWSINPVGSSWFNGGNVGIGTASPVSALHIAGNGIATFGPNSSYGASLLLGAAHATADASVGVSNGNMHLDPKNGYGLYLNWFATGTTGVFVGNGSAGYGPIYASGFTTASSRRFKKDISDNSSGLSEILKLQPKNFRYTNDPAGQKHVGFIAEEVEQVLPEVVAHDSAGQAAGIDYAKLSVALVGAVKTQQAEIQELRALLNRLPAK